MLKNKSKKLIAILLSVLLSGLIPAAVTLADNLIVDGDALVAETTVDIDNYELDLGAIEQGGELTAEIKLAISRQGNYTNGNVFIAGSSVEVSLISIINSNSVMVATDNDIAIPANWAEAKNPAVSGDKAISNITISVPLTATPDSYSFKLNYQAKGKQLDKDNAEKDLILTRELLVKYEVTASPTPSDTIKPTLSYSLSPSSPDGENGWYTSSVDVEFIYSDEDGGSGINPDTIPTNYTLSTDGVHGPNTVSISDNKGNTQTVTVPEIKIDKTNPTLTHILNPENPNGNSGWYTSPVTVDFTANDPAGGSGLNPDSVPANYSISVDGTTSVATYSVKDMAGNIGSTTVPPIKIDQTKPEISGAATTLPNNNNWYNADVTVRYDFSDATSGIIDEESTFEETVSTEAENQSSSHTVYDVAGNSETASVTGINIDKTAPVVIIDMPEEGKSYELNQVVLASWSASDSLSGIDSARGTVDSGMAIDTSSIGAKSFTVTATDLAGNTETKTVNYSVIYDFDGFFQPIDMDGINSAKAGSSIPIKFSLNGDMGLDILVEAKAYTYHVSSNTVTTEVEPVVTAGKSSLSYDPVTDQYTYIWKTDKAWAGSGRQLAVTLSDGTVHYAYFKFK